MAKEKLTTSPALAKSNCCGTCDCSGCSCECQADACRCVQIDCQCGCRKRASKR